tara:strand:- start:254 stop:412 length:159 start_codon:yes stop_codon:yes gene_type:complete
LGRDNTSSAKSSFEASGAINTAADNNVQNIAPKKIINAEEEASGWIPRVMDK